LNSNQFKIRKATKEDVQIISKLIHAIAEYEKLSHEVVATDEDLELHLFGENPSAEVLIGEEDGIPVGFALFFINFSTFLGKPGIHLEDLFIYPEHRKKGYGKKLFDAVRKIGEGRGYGRYEWAVLDWNKPAIDFYRAQGAKSMDEWITFRIENK